MARLTQENGTGGAAGSSRTWRWLVLVNRYAGTVRGAGADAVCSRIAARLADSGCIDVELREPRDIVARAREAARAASHDVIVVGGGDGTLSTVAEVLAGGPVILGVLPLGTMNMVARALGLASDFEQALEDLKTARTTVIDVGRVNGEIFLHQVSFGLQPRVVRIRDQIGYRSRFTKMLSTAAAFLAVATRHRTLKLVCRMNGTVQQLKGAGLAVSNNLYRDDKVAVARRLDGGVLGVYQVSPRNWRDYLLLVLAALRGTWRDSEMVQAEASRHVRLGTRRHKGKLLASVDGELVYLRVPVEIVIEPAALRMLVPQPAA